MNMNTELTPDQLASAEARLASQGTAMAKSLLNGGPGLGSFSEEAELSYETVWRPECLPSPFWSDLGSKVQDRLVDAFAEAFKAAFQPAPSTSDKELLVEAREVLEKLLEGTRPNYEDSPFTKQRIAVNAGWKSLQKLQSATR